MQTVSVPICNHLPPVRLRTNENVSIHENEIITKELPRYLDSTQYVHTTKASNKNEDDKDETTII